MKKNYDEIFDEAYQNAANDRRRLEEIAAKINEADPLVTYEIISTLTDSLTKINTQVIEMLKIESRHAPPSNKPENDDDDITEKEKSAIWDSIEKEDHN